MTDGRSSPPHPAPDLSRLDLVETAALLAAASRRLLLLASESAVRLDAEQTLSERGAAAEYESRRARDLAFEGLSGLFGEPAWDILLDLFDRESRGLRTGVSSASIAARVPATTALRYIGTLERLGLVERMPDLSDRRRTFLTLTGDGLTRMKAVFG